MLGNKTIKFLCTIIMLVVIIFCADEVFAATNYNSYKVRYNQNSNMYDTLSAASSYVGRYSDASLLDLGETEYKGMTSAQQTEIKNLANTILGPDRSSLTNAQKIKLFHDWITTNFYKYEHPERIYALKANGNNYDNPYYLYKYSDEGKIRARSNGFASTLVALARSQGLSARTVSGYSYTGTYDTVNNWTSSNQKTTKWVLIYYSGAWRTVDPYGDCSQSYDEINGYTPEIVTSTTDYTFLNPTLEDFSKSHVMLQFYRGSKNVKYVSSSFERKQIVKFLNKISNDRSNGKRVNYNYNTSNSGTWFTTNTGSRGDGYGRFVKINWPSKKGLAGSLSLVGFGKLQSLHVPSNKITSLSISNCPDLRKVTVTSNKMRTIKVLGSKKLTSLQTRYNPATYIKYNFGVNKNTAIVKAAAGGTVSVNYTKTKSKVKHVIRVKADVGYKFRGWYKGNKLVSKKTTLTLSNKRSFTYTAKFTKKSYIFISISRQQLWYYQDGVLVVKTGIVTGQQGLHSTPTGSYTLRSKARSVTLIGPDYRSWVDYWMLFDSYNQIGLHDATWRYSFGGTIYKYDGSHGCVNLPYDVAKLIYNTAPIGTKIFIK